MIVPLVPLVPSAKGRTTFKQGNLVASLTLRSGRGRIGARNVNFSLTVADSDLEGKFFDEGLVPGTAKDKRTEVIVKVLFNQTLYR